MYKISIFIFSAFLIFEGALYAKTPPYQERLMYRILFNGFFLVGKATIAFETKKDLYYLKMEAKSVNPVDVFFKVRDRFISKVAQDFKCFIFYEKRIREGGYKRHDIIHYNKKTLTYIKNGKLKKKLKIPPPLFDPFSILYAYRFTCKKDSICKIKATDGKKIEEVEVVPIKTEKIKIAAGVFEAIKVEPKWKKMKGVFRKKKKGHIYIWFTNDEKSIPLKVEASIFIGKIVGELVEFDYIPMNRQSAALPLPPS